MSEDFEPDFEAILDGLFDKTPEERIDLLATSIARQRERFTEALSAQSKARRALEARLARQERLTTHMLSVLLMLGGYFGAVALSDFWKNSEWWSLITLLSVALLIYLPLRDILGGQKHEG